MKLIRITKGFYLNIENIISIEGIETTNKGAPAYQFCLRYQEIEGGNVISFHSPLVTNEVDFISDLNNLLLRINSYKNT